MTACMEASPPPAATVAVACTLAEGHDGPHIAGVGKRILASWTQDGEPILCYDYSTGLTSRA